MSQLIPNNCNRSSDENSSRKSCNQYFEDDSSAKNGTGSSNNDTDSENDVVAKIMHRSKWKINTTINTEPIDFSKICSICLSDDDSKGELLISCNCENQRSHQHRKCIEEWIEMTGMSECSFCSFKYKYKKYSKSFMTFARCYDMKSNILLEAVGIAFLIYLSLIGVLVIFWSSRKDKPPNLEIRKKSFRIGNIIVTALVSLCTIATSVASLTMFATLATRYYWRYKKWTKNHFGVIIEAIGRKHA